MTYTQSSIALDNAIAELKEWRATRGINDLVVRHVAKRHGVSAHTLLMAALERGV